MKIRNKKSIKLFPASESVAWRSGEHNWNLLLERNYNTAVIYGDGAACHPRGGIYVPILVAVSSLLPSDDPFLKRVAPYSTF